MQQSLLFGLKDFGHLPKNNRTFKSNKHIVNPQSSERWRMFAACGISLGAQYGSLSKHIGSCSLHGQLSMDNDCPRTILKLAVYFEIGGQSLY